MPPSWGTGRAALCRRSSASPRSETHRLAYPSRIRLRQEGSMQLKPGRWRAFTAQQEMSVGRVEFS
jgi:hypothetical protein